jgi:aspartyl-tRNA synthetase
MTYAEAIDRYGIDKPDLRNPLELVEVADLMSGVEFKVFAGPAAEPPDHRVAALKRARRRQAVAQGDRRLHRFVAHYGAKGLAYIKVNELAKGRDGLQSPIIKFLPDATVQGLHRTPRTERRRPGVLRRRQGEDRQRFAGALRVKIGHDLKLAKPGWRRCG